MNSLTLFAITIALLLGAYASMRSDWEFGGVTGAVAGVAALVVGMVALVRNHYEHTSR
jgi:cobalamin synthase